MLNFAVEERQVDIRTNDKIHNLVLLSANGVLKIRRPTLHAPTSPCRHN